MCDEALLLVDGRIELEAAPEEFFRPSGGAAPLPRLRIRRRVNGLQCPPRRSRPSEGREIPAFTVRFLLAPVLDWRRSRELPVAGPTDGNQATAQPVPAAGDDAAAAAGDPPAAALAARADRRNPKGARRQPGARRGRAASGAATARGSAGAADGQTRARRRPRTRRARRDRGRAHRREAAREVDWEQFLENRTLQQALPANRGGFEELPPIEQNLTKPRNLADHLLWQLQMSDFTDNERRFAELVIGNLDEKGYLDLKGVERPDGTRTPDLTIEDLAERGRARSRGRAGGARDDPELRPVGVAARDLRECLLVQAEVLRLRRDRDRRSSTTTCTTSRSTTTRRSRAS